MFACVPYLSVMKFLKRRKKKLQKRNKERTNPTTKGGERWAPQNLEKSGKRKKKKKKKRTIYSFFKGVWGQGFF
jgi:hypothetical protein